MKTLFTIALLALCGLCKAQAYAYIWNSNADTVAIGDSVFIDIGYGYGTADANSNVVIQMTGNYNVAAWYTFATLDTVPKVWNAAADGYLARVRFIMPTGTQLGAINYEVYGHTYPVYVIDRTTGINELSARKTVQETHYYNLMGQEIQKPDESTSGLVIEEIIFTDKTIKTVKRFLNPL